MACWLRKNRLESTIPTEFSNVLDLVCTFGDPVIMGEVIGKNWDPIKVIWN